VGSRLRAGPGQQRRLAAHRRGLRSDSLIPLRHRAPAPREPS
jgi:hypothetical protein